jgi:hypothetical protein
MSWVAARTERVHLSGNVMNLPLRPPAVLAVARTVPSTKDRSPIRAGDSGVLPRSVS